MLRYYFLSPSQLISSVIRICLYYLTYCLDTPFHSRAHPILLRHSFSSLSISVGTGIFTCYPSDTHFCLSLGPDLLQADEPSLEILGFSACVILTHISLLMPTFSLVSCPQSLSILLRPIIRCSSTTHYVSPKLR